MTLNGHFLTSIDANLENMANTSSRTLRLLSLLQTHRYWPGPELADRLGVSVRTLRRDVDRLRELGYPVQAQRGVEGGYQLAAGAALPPLVVDDEEAVALAVGLAAAAQGPIEGIAEASVRALAKVVQVMPARLRRRVDALRAMTVPATPGSPISSPVDPNVLTTIALACRDDERITFDYVAADGRHTERHVEPHRLVSLGRRWYLVGYDLLRNDWRCFRIDRLAEPKGTGARFRQRTLPARDAAEFVRIGTGMTPVPTSIRTEVLVHAPAAQVREKIGRWSTIEEVDAGHCRMIMTSDSLDWPITALGTLHADFDVIGPPELADQLREWAGRLNRTLRS